MNAEALEIQPEPQRLTKPRPVTGTITPEKQREGQEKGRKTQSATAQTNRARWWDEGVKLIVDAFEAEHLLPSRADVIDGLRKFNLAYSVSGKRGEQIKARTITRWLSPSRWNVLCAEAVDVLIEREVIRRIR